MKVGYCILAHKDPAFINRVAHKLTDGTDNYCFIHIDAKSQEFKIHDENESGQIHWIENRIPVYWGGYSVVEAELIMLREAIEYGLDRYVIMHGADYPLFSNAFIEDYFSRNKDIEFIKAVNETTGSKREWYRYIPKNYLDRPNYIKRLKNKLNVIFWRSELPKPNRIPYLLMDGKTWDIYRGWGHFSITHRCAEYVLHFAETHITYNDFFKHVYVPDESYFHTIIFNTEWKYKTTIGKPIQEYDRSLENLLNLTYFEYPSSVRLFRDLKDYEYLKSTHYLFFRKASSASGALLDYIDQMTINGVTSESLND